MTPTQDRSDPAPGALPPGRRAGGGQDAFDRLFVAIERELRGIAHGLLRRNRQVDDVDTTVLVHDMYVKLSRSAAADWTTPEALLSAASEILRNLLTDAARRRRSRKRGGGGRAEDLEVVLERYEGRGPRGATSPMDLLDLDAALGALAAQDPRAAKMVELHYYLGVDDDEIAKVFGVSPRTVFTKLTNAKKVLKRYMDRTDRPPPPPDLPR